jgi:hypothetical protein
MRKITILAFATAALAFVTVVTDLIRADGGASMSTVSANSAVQQVPAAGGSNVRT